MSLVQEIADRERNKRMEQERVRQQELERRRVMDTLAMQQPAVDGLASRYAARTKDLGVATTSMGGVRG